MYFYKNFSSFFLVHIGCFFFALLAACQAQTQKTESLSETLQPQVGANQAERYLPLLKGKKVGLLVNHSSQVKDSLGKNLHLLDFLLQNKVEVVKIFAPEHGFRGKAEAGEKVESSRDSQTGLPIISLYGKNKKPSKQDFEGIDVLIFDIQDVGVRFYTYISTLHYAMETAAETGVSVLILDRPNPNGSYIAGTVLDTTQVSSFVGMHPIPIVHGLTIGELARMIVGEKWLKIPDSLQNKLDLHIITVENYTHQTRYVLPIAPSPNLANQTAVYLYPSLCLFEGTQFSVGRGTDFAFQVFGKPNFLIDLISKLDSQKDTIQSNARDLYLQKEFPAARFISFTPRKSATAGLAPLYEGELCTGIDLRQVSFEDSKFSLRYLYYAYLQTPENERANFFKSDFFSKLVGNKTLETQIREGKSIEEIEKSWEKDLAQYRQMREKYRLYPD
jgi:uncharacterized protein YbbC (DUF1343 family)